MALPSIIHLPYPLTRLVDLLMPLLYILTGFGFGSYTFLHLLLIERKPSRAFNFSYWQDQNFARLWKWIGPIVAVGDIKTVPAVVGTAEGVVLDVG